MDCNKSRGLTIRRHNAIRDHVGLVASSLGIPFEAEPLSLARGPNDIRADGLLQLGDALPANRYAFDVTVWHPTAPSHIGTAAHQLGVARFAADEKVVKFADKSAPPATATTLPPWQWSHSADSSPALSL